MVLSKHRIQPRQSIVNWRLTSMYVVLEVLGAWLSVKESRVQKEKYHLLRGNTAQAEGNLPMFERM